MEYALALVLSGCIAVAVVAAVVHTWALRARVFSLEDRMALVEGTLTREVKSRAGQERWRNPSKDEALINQLAASARTAKVPIPNWWETLPKVVDGK